MKVNNIFSVSIIYIQMPPKKAEKSKAKRKAPKMMQGEGFFGDLWSGVKKVGSFIKDNKLVSKGLKLIPDSRVQAATRAAEAVGLGKRRRRRPRKMKGMGVGPSPYLMDDRTIGASMIKT